MPLKSSTEVGKLFESRTRNMCFIYFDDSLLQLIISIRFSRLRHFFVLTESVLWGNLYFVVLVVEQCEKTVFIEFAAIFNLATSFNLLNHEERANSATDTVDKL